MHTAEIEQDPNKVEGAILISADITADQNSVARWLIDPGGGANTYMYAEERKILYPEITGTWRRNNPGEGQGAPAGGEHNAQVRGVKIKDPGGGGNIDHEVQEIKNRWGTKEDAAEISKRQEEKATQTFKARANRKEEPEEKKRAKNEAVYEVICGG